MSHILQPWEKWERIVSGLERRIKELERERDEARATKDMHKERQEELETHLLGLVTALEDEISDDSIEYHGFSTCVPGEGDEVNASRGCARCRSFLVVSRWRR